MSKSTMQKLLSQIETEIKSTSEAYRKLVSNFETHDITINAEEIAAEVSKEMKSRLGGKLTKETVSIIRTETRKMAKVLFLEFHPKRFDPTGKKYSAISAFEGTPTNFTFVLASKKGKRANIFNAFKKVKQKAQKPLIAALNKKIQSLNKRDGKERESIDSRKGFLDIGHSQDSSVSLQRAAKVQKALWNFSSTKSPLATKVINELQVAVTWEMKKDGKGPPKDTIGLSLESKRFNRASQSYDKSEVLELNKALKKVSEKIGTEWAELEGSDSSIEKRQKIIVEAFFGEIKSSKIKKKKVTKKQSKSYSGTVKHKSKKPKGSRVKFKDTTAGATVTVGSLGGSAAAPLALVALINKQLPNVLAKNMVEPRLVNQTGTFLNSVEATDMVFTRKGFPSIGYTYDKFPYQTFEVGFNQGSLQRDPRKLIDTSIREIAAQFAIGRIYTRRL